MAKYVKLSLSGSRALTNWLCSDDTGISSEAIVRVLVLGKKPNRTRSHPWDCGDFGRCYRLLKAVPELKPHLHKMADVSREWKELIKRWEELTELHEKRKKKANVIALNKMMITAIEKAEAARQKLSVAKNAAAQRAAAAAQVSA